VIQGDGERDGGKSLVRRRTLRCEPFLNQIVMTRSTTVTWDLQVKQD
jgi:hypothetical protein